MTTLLASKSISNIPHGVLLILTLSSHIPHHWGYSIFNTRWIDDAKFESLT